MIAPNPNPFQSATGLASSALSAIKPPKLYSSPYFQNCKTSFIKSEFIDNNKNLSLTTNIFSHLLKNSPSSAYHNGNGIKNFNTDLHYQNVLNFSMRLKHDRNESRLVEAACQQQMIRNNDVPQDAVIKMEENENPTNKNLKRKSSRNNHESKQRKKH